MVFDILNTEYTHGNYGDFRDAFAALSEEEKRKTFKALVLRSLPKVIERNLKDGMNEKEAREHALISLGVMWSQNLDCDGPGYRKNYLPLILNGD